MDNEFEKDRRRAALLGQVKVYQAGILVGGYRAYGLRAQVSRAYSVIAPPMGIGSSYLVPIAAFFKQIMRCSVAGRLRLREKRQESGTRTAKVGLEQVPQDLAVWGMLASAIVVIENTGKQKPVPGQVFRPKIRIAVQEVHCIGFGRIAECQKPGKEMLKEDFSSPGGIGLKRNEGQILKGGLLENMRSDTIYSFIKLQQAVLMPSGLPLQHPVLMIFGFV